MPRVVSPDALRAGAQLVAAMRAMRVEVTQAPLWTPLPGPQTLALGSEADELFYGGQAGGGKTDLILGAAATRHRRSAVFRRHYGDLSWIEDRSRALIGDRGRYNGQDYTWRLDDGRLIEFGAAQHEQFVQRWMGRPHDLKAFDEVAQFTEFQYRFLGGWARTTEPGQKVRVIAVGNPPTDAEGEWVIRRWGPWLDDTHKHPADPGELRWFVTLPKEDREVEAEDGTPFEYGGETLYPKSRTFIPAALADNPYLSSDPSYRATLQAMPDALRRALLYGDFTVGMQSDPWQVIPTEWIRLAQARWTPQRPLDDKGRPIRLTRLGADIAQGGKDRTVLAKRYDWWVAPLDIHPGRETPDANVNAHLVLAALKDGGVASIDANGIGSSTYWLCAARVGGRVQAFVGSEPTQQRDKAGVLTFVNLRALAYWRLRERLDPMHRKPLALPPGRELLAELAAPKFKVQASGVIIEKKDDIKKRLGRSIDLADAVAMSLVGMPIQAGGVQQLEVRAG